MTENINKRGEVGIITVSVLFSVGVIILLILCLKKHRQHCFRVFQQLKSSNLSTESSYRYLETGDSGTSINVQVTSPQFSGKENDDDDEFVYDEIFTTSEFTDEDTKQAIKNLHLATNTPDYMLEPRDFNLGDNYT